MFMKKLIVHEMLAVGFTMAQLFAPPIALNKESVGRLHSEARHKSEALQRALSSVYNLEEREMLVDRMIGFIILADVTNLLPEDVSAIISAPYFGGWIPIKDTRDVENLSDHIDPMQLVYMITPSDGMDEILRRALKGVAHPSVSWDDPLDEDGTTAYDLHEKMGPFTEMFLCARQDISISLPLFIEGTPRPQWMPTNSSRLSDGQPNKEFFIEWWKNIRYGFIETEGFASCCCLLEQKLKRALKKRQRVDVLFEKLKRQMPQASGLVGMSLDALKKNALMREKYPQWSEFIDELQRQINTDPGQ
jgi:hypothetical protein